jgi:hypothetical protein
MYLKNVQRCIARLCCVNSAQGPSQGVCTDKAQESDCRSAIGDGRTPSVWPRASPPRSDESSWRYETLPVTRNQRTTAAPARDPHLPGCGESAIWCATVRLRPDRIVVGRAPDGFYVPKPSKRRLRLLQVMTTWNTSTLRRVSPMTPAGRRHTPLRLQPPCLSSRTSVRSCRGRP